MEISFDAKKEDFRRYLERFGITDALAKVLVNLSTATEHEVASSNNNNSKRQSNSNNANNNNNNNNNSNTSSAASKDFIRKHFAAPSPVDLEMAEDKNTYLKRRKQTLLARKQELLQEKMRRQAYRYGQDE
eukprot:PhM_4_TR18228/c0_g1_i1/m.63476